MISVNVKTGEVLTVPDTIPLPTAAEVQARLDAEASLAAKAKLAQIDLQSVRALREFVLAKFPGDPLIAAALAQHDAAAAQERTKVK